LPIRTNVEATRIIGSTWRYRGTKHPRVAGDKVVIKAVHRHDPVDGDVVTLRDDALIQALRKGDKVEVAQLVEGEGGRERESVVVEDASPEDLEPLPAEPDGKPMLGRRW